MRVEVRRDGYGIPHLQAPDLLSLARLQGRVTARDRAWQVELDRWRMEGRAAELVGEGELGWDVLARQVGLEATAREAYHRLGEQTRAWVDAYVEGVNEALPTAAATSTELRRLGATGVRPWQPWTPLGIFWVCHLLFASFPTKLWRALVVERLGADALPLLGIEGESGSGSNAVGVAGALTAGGRPLVAGDPHRLLEIPGVYAQVHLRCPGVDVHGFTFPGVPGVQHFAHAGGVAWGITNAMADYQDLYLERLRRDGDHWQAEGPDGWAPVDARTETLTVRAPAPDADPDGVGRSEGGDRRVTVTCLRTPRGPVVTGLEPAELGVTGAPTHSLRVPSQVLGDLGFEALLPLLHARTAEDVERALQHWVEPVNSVVVADADGVRHLLAGRVPDRAEPLTRLPGRAWEAGDAWRGWREMPRRDVTEVEVNGNDRASGGDLGPEYAPPYRAHRLRELALASRPVTPDAARGWATDTRLGAVDVARPHLAAADVTGAAADLRDRLVGWDAHVDAGSEEAAGFAAWRTAFVHWCAAQAPLAPLHAPTGYPPLLTRWLDLPARLGLAWESLLVRGTDHGLDVAAGVRAALEEAATTTGPWGTRHRLVPLHGLGEPATPEVALSGDGSCVLATSSVPGVTDRCSRGPVARYVWDLAGKARSGWVVPFGAAGDPSSPHHHDQLTLWTAGDLVPLTGWDELTPGDAAGPTAEEEHT